jgi:hypothetical protein
MVDLAAEVRERVERLVSELGPGGAARALGEISMPALQRIRALHAPKPVRPVLVKEPRRPRGPADATPELVELVRARVRQEIEAEGLRPASREIRAGTWTALKKFAYSASRPYRTTWPALLAWYQEVSEQAPTLDANAVEAAIRVLIHDLADTPAVQADVVAGIRRCLAQVYGADAVAEPRQDPAPAPEPVSVRSEAGAAAQSEGAGRDRGPTLPGRRPARFRAGRLLRRPQSA